MHFSTQRSVSSAWFLDLKELARRRKDARGHGRCRFKDFVVTDAGESSPDLLVPFQTSGIHADWALDDCIQCSVAGSDGRISGAGAWRGTRISSPSDD
jgi:hypothetical protein